MDRGTLLTPEELDLVQQLAEEKLCLVRTKPELTLDPIVIVTDTEGRVYHSGAKPNPYTVTIQWCNYRIEAQGESKIVVLQDKPKDWGFRFRLKFYGSFLFLDAVERPSVAEGADLGLAADFLHYKIVNLNAQLGFRSVGASVGVDLTKNFGVLGGLSYSFWTLRPNPMVGLDRPSDTYHRSL
jgi:hypothetical protein